MKIGDTTRLRRRNGISRRQPFGSNAFLSGIGAVALLLLLAAGIATALMRRLSA